LPENALPLFQKHARMITEWNQRLNLTRISEEEMAEKHFVDSLTVLLVPKVNDARNAIDIGSGAGFPGIPLKVVRPDMKITLVDSLGKRVKFLERVVRALELEGIRCYHSRAEEMGQDKGHREKYDVALARAVASLVLLCEYLLPLVRIGGIMVALKGPSGKEEVKEAERALDILGGRVEDILELSLPSGDGRQLVVIEKVGETPRLYPRRPGMARKDPLI
ncbi:MAG: 16S rRNA (guanine(527)-N(7))-methyltransferase RsmG, partial [Firmicutes bacterium]|nr:16S rRNA (guanine(527)-N(7))-methyltransferase RsmG [Bacillota bacterium]